MIAAGVIAVRARKRYTGVVLVSVTGLGMVVLFATSGAPDLALTQILVETVTLVAFALVLRRIPSRLGAHNGSAFAGYGAGAPFHTTLQGIAMTLGRYAFIVPMLAIAGSLAGKASAPTSTGTFPTHGPLFVVLLMTVVLIMGGLTFFPALALGPLAEHVSMAAGQSFGGISP